MVIILVLVALLNLPDAVSGRVKDALREGVAPLQQVFSVFSFRIKEAGTALRGLGGAVRENREMAAELTRLRGYVRHLREVENENIELRNQLLFSRRSERELIPCEVIGRDISGWWHSVRLWNGRADGVETNQAVITSDGLVGKVMDVSAHTSDVLLISDPNCRISVRISRTGSFGISTGRGASLSGEPLCQLDFIDKNSEIRPGDEVTTSGLGGVFPRGLLVGYIENVTQDESGLYQSAHIVPTADLGKLAYVFVVSEKEDPAEALLRQKEEMESELEVAVP
ncbi:MAG: rod shape-determining protein MreC [Spartobacteria bacterium]|nr:rod shape-determining protein MreC [Spartobacteria bacterium]